MEGPESKTEKRDLSRKKATSRFNSARPNLRGDKIPPGRSAAPPEERVWTGAERPKKALLGIQNGDFRRRSTEVWVRKKRGNGRSNFNADQSLKRGQDPRSILFRYQAGGKKYMHEKKKQRGKKLRARKGR